MVSDSIRRRKVFFILCARFNYLVAVHYFENAKLLADWLDVKVDGIDRWDGYDINQLHWTLLHRTEQELLEAIVSIEEMLND